MGCLGEARAHRQRTELASGRPAPRERHAGTAGPPRRGRVAGRRSGSTEARECCSWGQHRRRPAGRCTDDCQTRQALSTYPRPSTALSTIPLDSESPTARWVNASGEVRTMLIQRLRVLLLHSCRDHVVAYCPSCRRGFSPNELGSDEFIGRRFHVCGSAGQTSPPPSWRTLAPIERALPSFCLIVVV